jgi:DUF1680 family protein
MRRELLRRSATFVPLLACIAFLSAQAPRRAPVREYPIQAVPFYQVTVDDAFWAPRIERNRTVSIPHIMSENERTGRVANFEVAAGRREGTYQGKRFNDSDVYKTIEAAAYTLRTHPDAALQSKLERIVGLMANSQLPDGYLYPARTIFSDPPVAGIGPERWVNLNGSHELYNMGHLYEAALAWQAAAGKDDLMKVALRNIDLVAHDFGPAARKAVPGHEEVELALVKLFRATGNQRFFDLARFFLDQRGHPHDTQPYPADSAFAIYNDRPYMQDQAPLTEQTRAIGHAVRAMYVYSAMTDVAALAGDEAYGKALDLIWNDMVSRRMYVTGGIGSRGSNEGFGDDYELPNGQAYAETCASVGSDLWNERMFLLHGDAKYVDVLERVLYNGYLSGVSIAGDTFFYQNPLASSGDVERSSYFEVACCPSNLARLMAQMPGLIYAHKDDVLFVNLFVGSRAQVALAPGKVTVSEQTQYPWDGKVRVRVQPEKPMEFALYLRVPGWARNEPVPGDLYRFSERSGERPMLSLNGKAVPLDDSNIEAGAFGRGYARIRRRWMPGDVVELVLPMPVRRVLANDAVKADSQRAAIERGPLVYALEAVDNNGRTSNLVLPLHVILKHEFRPEMLGGIGVITGPGLALMEEGENPRKVQVTAIPYFAWANRYKGEMDVWVPYRIEN